MKFKKLFVLRLLSIKAVHPIHDDDVFAGTPFHTNYAELWEQRDRAKPPAGERQLLLFSPEADMKLLKFS